MRISFACLVLYFVFRIKKCPFGFTVKLDSNCGGEEPFE